MTFFRVIGGDRKCQAEYSNELETQIEMADSKSCGIFGATKKKPIFNLEIPSSFSEMPISLDVCELFCCLIFIFVFGCFIHVFMGITPCGDHSINTGFRCYKNDNLKAAVCHENVTMCDINAVGFCNENYDFVCEVLHHSIINNNKD